MTDPNAPLLDLDTVIARPIIAIDGEQYELISPDELPLETSHLMAAKGRQMQKLQTSAELNRDQAGQLRAIVRQLSDIVMERIPEEVRAKITIAQRLQVIEAFTALLLKRRLASAAAMMPGQQLMQAAMAAFQNAPSTGESTSPGSSDSSAETPKAG
jgi:tRNA 2-selenouridine synthase SelU